MSIYKNGQKVLGSFNDVTGFVKESDLETKTLTLAELGNFAGTVSAMNIEIKNGTVYFDFNVDNVLATSTFITIGTIAEKYRPKSISRGFGSTTSVNYPSMVTVYPNGTVTVYQASGNTTGVACNIIYNYK